MLDEKLIQDALLWENSQEKILIHYFHFFSHYLHKSGGGFGSKQHLLKLLLLHEGTISQRELQELIPIKAATLSETLSKLEAEGLIEKERLETDKRSLQITLTEAGERAAEEVVTFRRTFATDLFSIYDEQEKSELIASFEKLQAHINDLATERSETR